MQTKRSPHNLIKPALSAQQIGISTILNFAMPSKRKFIQEHFNGQTIDEAHSVYDKNFKPWAIPERLSSWTKLQLPYEAQCHPGIPSFDEIERGMKENRLSNTRGLYGICRVGKCVVKRGRSAIILQVSGFEFAPSTG